MFSPGLQLGNVGCILDSEIIQSHFGHLYTRSEVTNILKSEVTKVCSFCSKFVVNEKALGKKELGRNKSEVSHCHQVLSSAFGILCLSPS